MGIFEVFTGLDAKKSEKTVRQLLLMLSYNVVY